MVEIPEGVWTRPLEIEQSYGVVHKERVEDLVLDIEEERVTWYYDIMKFLELGAYYESKASFEVSIGKDDNPYYPYDLTLFGYDSVTTPNLAEDDIVSTNRQNC